MARADQDLSDIITQTSRTCCPHLSLCPCDKQTHLSLPRGTEPEFSWDCGSLSLLTKREMILGYFRSRTIAVPRVVFLEVSKHSEPPFMSNLALFYASGVWLAFTSLGIAREQTGTWSCLLWASLSLLHWPLGISAHFGRQAPSRQRLWPPQGLPRATWPPLGLILIYPADTLDQIPGPSRHC